MNIALAPLTITLAAVFFALLILVIAEVRRSLKVTSRDRLDSVINGDSTR